MDPLGRLSGDFRLHKYEKIFAGGEGKISILQDSVVCAEHKKQGETRYICKLCILFHKGSCFEKYSQ